MPPGYLELREYPSGLNTQRAIFKGVFGAGNCENLEPFFRYYHRQCKQVTSIAMTDCTDFQLRKHADLLEIITIIRNNTPHYEVVTKLMTKWNTGMTSPVIQNVLDLAMRLLTMIDVGAFSNAYTGRDHITFTNGTLAEFLRMQGLFDARPVIPCDNVKLESHFHACNIERIAGLTIQLTTNLCDHLLLREDSGHKVVYVFHHAAFLQCHLRNSSVFPPEFIEETLQTFAILFPKGIKKIERWYRGKGNIEDLDFTVLRFCPSQRRVGEYQYWRDRLVTLKEAFDDSQPRSLSQWWHDRRDVTQWYAVWVAVFFTVFFGLIQSVVGILQLYKAYRPT
ncbi:hypothetical protein F5Y16DRAFT_363428 [Xylariaceae sp. FL0255]|nr:hypothetical protein F5Y16DRAFT_363428 [Xylariaceae sp. FL0255]